MVGYIYIHGRKLSGDIIGPIEMWYDSSKVEPNWLLVTFFRMRYDINWSRLSFPNDLSWTRTHTDISCVTVCHHLLSRPQSSNLARPKFVTLARCRHEPCRNREYFTIVLG